MEPQVMSGHFITFYKPSLADLLAHDGWAHQQPCRVAGGFGSDINVQGTPSLPNISVAGFFTLSQAITGPLLVTTFMACAMCSAPQKTHTINAGAEVYLEKDRLETLLNNYGAFSFTSAAVPRQRLDRRLIPGQESAMPISSSATPTSMSQDSPDDAK